MSGFICLDFAGGCAGFIYSIVGIFSIVNNIQHQRREQLNQTIADACNYTYFTFIKPTKLEGKWTEQSKDKAMICSIIYVTTRYKHKIDENNLKRMIEERLTFVTKQNKTTQLKVNNT
jgi:hypothetical protein